MPPARAMEPAYSDTRWRDIQTRYPDAVDRRRAAVVSARRRASDRDVASAGCGPHHLDVAVVDPGDDSLDRYVVYHYRYDPGRNERRSVVVIAYDIEQEFLAEVECGSLEAP